MSERIVAVDDVPEDGSFLFTLRRENAEGAGGGGTGTGDGTSNEEREAILVRGPDGEIHAWENYCRHLIHIPLDKGSGAPIRDDEIVCTNHGAMFETDTGRCTFGPCEGAFLQPVAIDIEDGSVRLTDDRFSFSHVGESETGTDWDLGSTSNVEL